MNRRQLALIAIAAVLVVAIVASIATLQLDPATTSRISEGRIALVIPASIVSWSPTRSAYPTASFDPPRTIDTSRPIERTAAARPGPPPDLLKILGDAGRAVLDRVFSFFVQDARAAGCTGTGSCFWVGGTGNFSQTTHWATTSGGGTTGGLPAATDAVTFDANSGSGTATQNNATFTSGAATMTNSSVTISGSSNLWKVGGSWADANAHFSSGNISTVEFTASGTVSGATSTEFWHLTIDVGVVITMGNSFGVGVQPDSLLTLNGTLLLNGSELRDFSWVNGGTFGPAGTGTVDGSAGGQFMARPNIATGQSSTWTTSISFVNNPNLAFAFINGAPATMILGQSVNVGTGTIQLIPTTVGPDVISTNGFAITAGALNTLSSTGAIAFITGTSALFLGSVSWTGVLNYISSSGGGSWIVSGNWTNASTSSSWSFAAPITFTSAIGGTMTFAGANLPGVEFANVTFTSSAGTAQTFTMATRGLRVSGTLTVSDGSSTTTLDTSASNLAITTANLTIGTGGILNARASTITISGDLTITGTYTGANATTVLSGTTQTIAANGANLGLLQATQGGSKTFTQSFSSGLVSFTDGINVRFHFAGGITWTYTGADLSGPQHGQLTMRSSDGGAYTLSIAVGISAFRVAVSGCNATQPVNATDLSNVDNGGNGNWIFAGQGGTGVLHILVSCRYNAFLLSWSCEDQTAYAGWEITAVSWIYDGAQVASSSPQTPAVSFPAVGSSWLDPPRDHRLLVKVTTATGGQPYQTFDIRADQTLVWYAAAFVIFLVIVAAIASHMRGSTSRIYFVPFSNPNHRRTAISQEEYPPGWISYRQTDPDQYTRFRSEKQGKDRWIVYGIRPATEAEQARTGRKYIAEVQTVRERIR